MSADLTLDDHGHSTDSARSVRGLLASRRADVGLLAASSVLGGLVEALFLVSITRAAFAITDGKDEFGLVAGREVSVTAAVLFSLTFVLVRVALAIAATWQSARLSASVIADVRRDLAQAFMRASWSSQHGERSGRLQELLTTFAQQGAELVNCHDAGDHLRVQPRGHARRQRSSSIRPRRWW